VSEWADIARKPLIVNQHMLAGARKKGMSEYEAAVDLASRRLHPVPTHVRSATGKIRPIAVTQTGDPPNMKNRIALGLVATAVVLGAAACGMEKQTEQFRDAGRADTNDNPADVITMPDGFSNVAAKCDGTTRVYVVFKGDSAYGSVAVSPEHPDCGGKLR